MKKKNITYPKNILSRFTHGVFKDISLIKVFTGTSHIPEVYIKSLIEIFFNNVQKDGYVLYTDGRFIWLNPNSFYCLVSKDERRLAHYIFDDMIASWEERLKNGFELISSQWDALVEKQGYDSNIQNLNELKFVDWSSKEFIKFLFPDVFNNFICFGRPDYIDWCINNIDDFFMEDDILTALELLPVQVFSSVCLKKMTNSVFEIVHSNKTYFYKWSTLTREVNARKYNKFIKDRNQEKLGEIENEINSYKEIESYSEEENNSDAFGGQDDAYWNID